MANADEKKVRVEMSADTIGRLLAGGQVCAAEFRCLDCRSKECLWRLCLKSCTVRTSSDRKMVSTFNDSCHKKMLIGP